MRAPDFSDLTPEERWVLNEEIAKAKRWLKWNFSRERNQHLLTCTICQEFVGAVSSKQADHVFRTHRSINLDYWYLKKFYLPHQSTRSHQYNEMIGRLAGD